VQDGSSSPPPARVANDGILPPANAGNVTTTSSAQDVLRLANSPEEARLIAALFGPRIGVDPQDMPGWSSLLLGPLVRGTEVTVK
jgi:hypothetical protein